MEKGDLKDISPPNFMEDTTLEVEKYCERSPPNSMEETILEKKEE